MALKVLGSKCNGCSEVYNGNNRYLFELHHIVQEGITSRGDPPAKFFRRKCTAEEFADYISKCIPMCPTCHAKVEHGDLNLTNLPDPKVVYKCAHEAFIKRIEYNKEQQIKAGCNGRRGGRPIKHDI